MAAMFVCSCRAVTDRAVADAIDTGASTITEIANRCQAGSRCGGCWPELLRLLAERTAHRQQDQQFVGV